MLDRTASFRCLGGAFWLAIAWLAASSAIGAESGDLDALRAEARSLVNQARHDGGLPPLESTETLNAAAQRHAEDMLQRDYYGHESPDGETVEDRLRELGGSRWQWVAENIAECRGCGTPPTSARVRSFQRGWMNSRPHRENILGRGLDGFGFGIAAGDGGRIVAVQTFSGPGRPRGPASDELSERLSDPELAMRAVQAVNRERQSAGAPGLTASRELDGAAAELLPEDGGMPFSGSGGKMELPPGLDARRWRELQMLAGVCGGCGAVPTAADVRYFVDRWLGNRDYRHALLAPEASHLGFALRAGGTGRKSAVAVIGRAR